MLCTVPRPEADRPQERGTALAAGGFIPKLARELEFGETAFRQLSSAPPGI